MWGSVYVFLKQVLSGVRSSVCVCKWLVRCEIKCMCVLNGRCEILV